MDASADFLMIYVCRHASFWLFSNVHGMERGRAKQAVVARGSVGKGKKRCLLNYIFGDLCKQTLS